MRVSPFRKYVIRGLALTTSLTVAASPAFAADQAAEPVNFLQPHAGLMVWTIIIFVVLMFILSRFAFKPLYAAVEAREKALEDAVEGARRDREEAKKYLEQQREQLDAARSEAQKIIADSRVTGEKIRADMLDSTRVQQHEMIEQARRTIEGERDEAFAAMHRETIELAIAGASRLIEGNLDTDANRRMIDSYLSSVGSKVRH